MPRPQYHLAPHPFVAGSLGHLEGLTLLAPADLNTSTTACHYFGGLPYALPPTGQYRFRKPRPLPEGYRYGTKANPGRFTGKTGVCPQPKRNGLQTPYFDEDCLQLNIFLPAGDPPSDKGWPVFFYIHGGFLQWGSPDVPQSMAGLLSETDFRAIIVAPAYRVNMFGFISGKELQAEAERNGDGSAGNMGFWDQRLALEWTAKNIAHFGGDASNITCGGYSAGSHSAFHQLAHELYFVSDDKAIIKRTIMWSNSPGVQPRTPAQHQAQFEELLSALDIPLSLSAKEKLQRLRALPSEILVDVLEKLTISEFRATTDNQFVSRDLIANINSGDFGKRMKARGIKLMNGECRDEHTQYVVWRTPSQSFNAVRTRLIADYPAAAVDKLMQHYCGPTQTLPLGIQDWQELFGRVYANMQVHCLERGLHRGLARGGLTFGKDVLRYRIEWRTKTIDGVFPPEQGVTHASDLAVWFWGLSYGDGIEEKEKDILRRWLKGFTSFVAGDEDFEWGTTDSVKDMRRFRSDGQIDTWVDDRWEEGIEVWDLVNGNAGPGLIGWIKAKI